MQTLYAVQFSSPLVRVIQGVQTSWDPNIASIKFPNDVCATAWSPCSKLIAVAWNWSSKVVVLDAVTLGQLYTMHPPDRKTTWKHVIFSPNSSLLTGYSQRKSCIVTWDLQTGGLISNINTVQVKSCNSLSYSECGIILGCLFDGVIITTFNVLSGIPTSSHSIQHPVVKNIWTHSEYFQFATVESKSINVWKVSPIPNHIPTKVGFLPTPDNLSEDLVLLPALFWLSFTLKGRVLVWDAEHHRYLLDSTDVVNPRAMSFSPNGHFFTCGTMGQEFHIWKKSPDGYLPYQKLASSVEWVTPIISPNGELIVSFGSSLVSLGNSILELWHLTSSATPPSIVSAQTIRSARDFLVELSLDGSFIAVTARLSNTVTILGTTSSNPRIVVDTDAKICGMRMTDDKIIVICDGKIITWELPTGNSLSTSRKSISDSVQITRLSHLAPIDNLYASISPDLNYIAFGNNKKSLEDFCIYNTSTGQRLAVVTSDGWIPGFTPDNHQAWCATANGRVDQWAIVKGSVPNTIKLKELGKNIKPLSGFPWHSPDGFRVTDDGWVVNSNGKWLLWLPRHWRPDKRVQKSWGKKSLAIWNKNLPEPVILMLDV